MRRFVRRNQAPAHEERRLQLEVKKERNDVFRVKHSNNNFRVWQVTSKPAGPVSNHYHFALKRNGECLCGKKSDTVCLSKASNMSNASLRASQNSTPNKPQPEPRVTQRRKTGAGNLTLHEQSLRVAMQAPSRFRSTLDESATFPVISDSGASVTITPTKANFDGPIEKPSTITHGKELQKGDASKVKATSNGRSMTPLVTYAR